MVPVILKALLAKQKVSKSMFVPVVFREEIPQVKEFKNPDCYCLKNVLIFFKISSSMLPWVASDPWIQVDFLP